jgi:hypothetical protein
MPRDIRNAEPIQAMFRLLRTADFLPVFFPPSPTIRRSSDFRLRKAAAVA